MQGFRAGLDNASDLHGIHTYRSHLADATIVFHVWASASISMADRADLEYLVLSVCFDFRQHGAKFGTLLTAPVRQVASMMPSTEKDTQSVAKKRHLGNNSVTVVFMDEGADPIDPGVFCSNFQKVLFLLPVHCPPL